MSPALLALASAVLFSTGGAAIKATSWNSWQVAGVRSAIAAAAIAALLPGARKLGSRRVWLVGLVYALTLVLFVTATKLTTAANAIFLQSGAPIYLLLLGPWLLKEPVRKSDWAVLAGIAVGMMLVFAAEQQPLASAPNPVLGNWLAAATGVTWALTVAGLRWVGKAGEDAMAPVLAGNMLAALLCVVPMWPLPALALADLLALLYLGLFQIALAYWCLAKAVRGLGALEAALLVMLEPALNPFWTWAMHGERPAGLALVGGGFILAATAAQGLWRR